MLASNIKGISDAGSLMMDANLWSYLIQKIMVYVEDTVQKGQVFPSTPGTSQFAALGA